jgi:hypothetical protein
LNHRAQNTTKPIESDVEEYLSIWLLQES